MTFSALACFSILLSDSCTTRYNVVATSDFSLPGWVSNNISISICECSLKSSSSVVSAACKPRSSSALGRKWCEIRRTSLIAVINECWDFSRCTICLGSFSWLASNSR
ncbi:Uncharacterised protein [Vibrio cholerae]|nr:Uncharacterised protein [Vibrio cholerae]